jgi:hypothetical protein
METDTQLAAMGSSVPEPDGLEPEPEQPAENQTLRHAVTWVGVIGTSVLGAFFFAFMMYQALYGAAQPANWLTAILQRHYAALVGTPMSAMTAFCVVSILKATSGPIELDAFGVKFRGASGPIILWAICFLAVVSAFHLLWGNV